MRTGHVYSPSWTDEEREEDEEEEEEEDGGRGGGRPCTKECRRQRQLGSVATPTTSASRLLYINNYKKDTKTKHQ